MGYDKTQYMSLYCLKAQVPVTLMEHVTNAIGL